MFSIQPGGLSAVIPSNVLPAPLSRLAFWGSHYGYVGIFEGVTFEGLFIFPSFFFFCPSDQIV